MNDQNIELGKLYLFLFSNKKNYMMRQISTIVITN